MSTPSFDLTSRRLRIVPSFSKVCAVPSACTRSRTVDGAGMCHRVHKTENAVARVRGDKWTDRMCMRWLTQRAMRLRAAVPIQIALDTLYSTGSAGHAAQRCIPPLSALGYIAVRLAETCAPSRSCQRHFRVKRTIPRSRLRHQRGRRRRWLRGRASGTYLRLTVACLALLVRRSSHAGSLLWNLLSRCQLRSSLVTRTRRARHRWRG